MPDTLIPAEPHIERHRHELKRRTLTVRHSERLTPHMQRITLTGPDLAGFLSLAPDDHIKIFLPGAGEEPERRDYTPRRFDPATQELVLDFALHEAGPATRWAMQAAVGDTLAIGGPRGSQVIAGDIAHWLLIGDETALPAIGRRIEEAAAETGITSLVAVPGPDDEQSFTTSARLDALWLHRPEAAAADPAPVLAAVRALVLPPRCFVWIATEGTVMQAVRAHFLEERGLPPHWVKGAGYWIKGQADAG